MYDDIIDYINEQIEKRKELVKKNTKTMLIASEPEYYDISADLYRLIKEKLNITVKVLAAIDKNAEITKLLKTRKEFVILFLEARMCLETAFENVICYNNTYKIHASFPQICFNLSRRMNELNGLCDGEEVLKLFETLNERKSQHKEFIEKNKMKETKSIYGNLKK